MSDTDKTNVVVKTNQSVYVNAGEKYIDVTVESLGQLHIRPQGSAVGSQIENAVVYGNKPIETRPGSGRYIPQDGFIFNHGTVSNLTVEAYGRLNAQAGSVNENIEIKQNGSMLLSGKNAKANNVTISGGLSYKNYDYQLEVTAGGAVSNVVIQNGGTEGVKLGGVDENALINGGSQTVKDGGLAKNATVKSGSQIVIGANWLDKAGKTEKTFVQGGEQIVSEFGWAIQTFVEKGSQTINDGIAQEGSIAQGAKQFVYEGISNNTIIAGQQIVGDGSTTASGKISDIIENAKACSLEDVIAEGGSQVINAGGAVEDVLLEQGASMAINNQGVLDGDFNVGLSGSTAYFNSGAVVAGKFATMGEIFVKENVRFADDQAGFYLWVDALNTGSIAGNVILHDFNLLGENVNHCFISVSGDVASNTYALADGAGNFAGEIGIYNEDWYDAYSTLTVNGGTVTSNYVDYTLYNQDGTLYVDIVNNTIYDETLDLQTGGKIAKAQFETNYAGRYKLQDFINADGFSGTVVIQNSSGKKLVSLQVVDGKIKDEKKNNFLLDAGTYTMTCTAKTDGVFKDMAQVHVVHEEVFFRANRYDDDLFYQLNDEALRIDAAPNKDGKVEVVVSDIDEYYEYVGYQDLKDYRQINITNDGIYSIDLTKNTGTKTALRATLYQVSGTKLKKVAGVTLKDAAEFGALIKDKQLAAGTYYLLQESTGGKSGYATTYGAVLTGEVLDKAPDGSHAALTTVLEAFEGKENTLADTVNFASPEIYYSWEVESDGIYKLSALADVAKSVGNNALTITVWNTADGKTSMSKVLSFSTKNVKLDTPYSSKETFLSAGEYFISVKSSQTGKGAQVDFTLTEELVKDYPAISAGANNFANAATVTVSSKKSLIMNKVYAGYDDPVEWINLDLAGEIAGGGKFNFTITNSSFANSKVTVTVYQLLDNNKLKKLKSVSVAAGKSVDIKKLNLTGEGVYFIQLDGSSANKSKKFGEISISITTEELNNGVVGSGEVTGDNQIWHLDKEYCFSWDGKEELVAFEEEQLGGSDAVDYRKITLENAGYCNFELTSQYRNANLTATVYKWNSTGTALSKVTSLVLKSNAQDPSVALKKDILLAAGEYYIEVKCAKTANGGYGNYELTANMSTVFDHKDMKTDDDNYAAAAGLSLADVADKPELISDGYVGYGDTIDFIKLEDVKSGQYEFAIKADGKTTFTLYRYDEKSNKLVSLVSKTYKNGGELSSAHLEEGAEYYLAVKAGDTKNAIAYEINADCKLAQSINAAYDADDSVEIGAMHLNGTAWVNFDVTGEDAGWKYTFEDTTLGKMTLYMYNESNGKLKKISYKANKEIALAEGSYYLELKADSSYAASSVYFDCSDRAFSWEKSSAAVADADAGLLA